MTVETFSMDAELAPFMSGDVHIFDMRMVRPRAIVEVAEGGAIDWTVRPSTPIEASRISVEKLTITEGRVGHPPRAKRAHPCRFRDQHDRLGARPFRPLALRGSARLDGRLAGISGSTGRLEEDGAMRVKLRVEPDRYPMSVEADGAVEARDGALHYAGTFRVDEKVAPAAAAGQAAEPAKPTEPAEPGNRLKGAFALDSRRLDLSDVRFETGPVADPYTRRLGDGRFRPGAALCRDGQGRADPLRRDGGARGRKADAGAAPEGAGEQPGRASRATMPARSTSTFRPSSSATRRSATCVSWPSRRGGWKLNSSGATLPGRTTLEASGFITTGEDFHFTGSLLLAVGQPSGFAAWVSKDIDEAIRRLPAAGFQPRST